MEGIEITEFVDNYEFISVSEVVSQALSNENSNISQNVIAEKQINNEIKSGFKDLDKIIHKFENGQLITIAVRPGKGKTAFLLSLIYNLTIKNSTKIGVFSPERSSAKLVQRLVESETGSSAEKIYSGNIKEHDKSRINGIINNLLSSTIIINDSTSLTAEDIEKRCIYLKEKNNVDVILVDHIELYSRNILDSESNYDDQSKVMSVLKNVATKINIPIIAFSQITNTQNLTTPNSKPDINNVSENTRDLSDVIMFIHRPNVLNYDKPEFIEWKGCAEIIVVKHPQIESATSVKLKFIESSDKFTNLD